MKKTLIFISIIIALTACTGSSKGDSDSRASRQPKHAHELRFLRDMGINPDSMIIDDRWVMPHGDDWETRHNRWLDMKKIQALGLDQLCDADTDNSPITIVSVWPADEHYTMIIFHQYLGDSAPIHLVTYDGDGIPMDHLNLGTAAGPNLRYWDKAQKSPAVETCNITFNGRMMTVERNLSLTTQQGKTLWQASNTDSYEIDNRGYIMHREGSAQLDGLPDQMRPTRQLEATLWYSIQDEQAMDALSKCLDDCPGQVTGTDVFQRLYVSPWTTAHWLYVHQDSPLVPLLAQGMKELDKEVIDRTLEPVRDPDQNAFLKKLL